MANREELLIIRAARAGKAPAQLALGKRYLFGGGGFPLPFSDSALGDFVELPVVCF